MAGNSPQRRNSARHARPRLRAEAHAVHVAEQALIGEADLPLVQEFIGEAGGHIEAAEAAPLQLEEDASNADAVNSVFRSFHTIKGVAGFLNLTQIGALAQRRRKRAGPGARAS